MVGRNDLHSFAAIMLIFSQDFIISVQLIDIGYLLYDPFMTHLI